MKFTLTLQPKFRIMNRIIYFLILVAFLSGCRSSKQRRDSVSVEAIILKEIEMLEGDRKGIVKETLTWVGTPYKYAGCDKGDGTDCSGMVLRVYEDVTGIKLPRNSRQQSEFCDTLKHDDVRPGDLVFFATGKDPEAVSHVGIMIDDNRFVHSSTKKGVIMSEMTTPYYKRTFIMYGKVPGMED